MELYFKDLEEESGTCLTASFSEDADVSERAEDQAFAELSERVSAARLVY